METTYAIIKALQGATGNLEKQAILDAQAGNEDLKAYLKAVYDPAISYYMKKAPKVAPENLATLDNEFVAWMLKHIAGRTYTGSRAVAMLKASLACMDAEGQELVQLMLDRKIGASVGDTMVLKAFPGLYFIPPYQRCALMDDKSKERFGKLKRFYIQTKADGSFAYLVKWADGTADIITRQGNTYPKEFADKLTEGQHPGTVIVGELLVYRDGVMLDRKTGNGILSSVQKEGEGLQANDIVQCSAWNALTVDEFKDGKSTVPYEERLKRLCEHISNGSQAKVIDTWEVKSLAEAYAIYTDHTSRGLEGCIAVDPDDPWKAGTSKGTVKMKLKFEAEYRCRGIIEGEGKAKGMVGAIEIETEDGLLECNCGTGFSDKQRKEFFDNPSLIVDEVVMLSANDIIQSRDTRKKPALSLPVFEEVRYDKKTVGANTLAEVEAILAAAKEGKQVSK